jgi:hypothetical protein
MRAEDFGALRHRMLKLSSDMGVAYIESEIGYLSLHCEKETS